MSMQSHRLGNDAQLHRQFRVLALSENPTLNDALARVLDGEAAAAAEVLPPGVPAHAITDWGADLVLVDIPAHAPIAPCVEPYIDTQAKIVAVGAINDVATYREAVGAGAFDYLLHPVSDDAILDVMQKAQAAPVAPQAGAPLAVAPIEENRPTVTVVIGARGGVGATSLAVSLAWTAAEQHQRETALIDLDMQFGSSALALDLLPSGGLRDALANPQRIDSLFIGSAMVNASDRLFVLGAEEGLAEPAAIAPGAFETLFETLEGSFSSIIVDLPRAMVSHAETLLQRADAIILVTDHSIAGLRDVVRMQDHLSDTVGSASIQIAAIETPKPVNQVSRKELEQGLGSPVHIWLPYDPALASSAASQGKALTDLGGVKHAYSKALAAPARDAAGMIEEKAGRKRKWLW